MNISDLRKSVESQIAECLARRSQLDSQEYYRRLKPGQQEQWEAIASELASLHGVFADALTEAGDGDGATYHREQADYAAHGFAAYGRSTEQERRDDLARSRAAKAAYEAEQAARAERKRAAAKRAKALRPVRQAADLVGTPYPIEIVDGDAAPKLVGESYHWTTPGGAPVHYPNAYRRAWGKPVYVGSTFCIQVGREWLKANGINVEE